MKNGVDLAVAEAGGAVAGFCLEVVNLDDASPQTGKWDGAVEAENANKAVGDPLAIVYIGTYNSGAAKVSIPITNRAHMAQVTPANTYPGLTKKRGAAPGEPEIYRPGGFVNYFRPDPGRRHPGRGGGQVGQAAAASRRCTSSTTRSCTARASPTSSRPPPRRSGSPIVANEGIDWKQPDQKPILTKIRASGADLVYLGGVIETGAQVVIRQMKEVGLVAPAHPLHGARRPPRGGAAEGRDLRRRAGHRDAHHLRRPAVREDARRRREDLRDLQGEVRQGADLLRALRRRGHAGHHRRASSGPPRPSRRPRTPTEKREALRKAIASTKNFEGINGKWSFDENGDVDYDTMSGFKAVKADGPIGCKFAVRDHPRVTRERACTARAGPPAPSAAARPPAPARGLHARGRHGSAGARSAGAGGPRAPHLDMTGGRSSSSRPSTASPAAPSSR